MKLAKLIILGRSICDASLHYNHFTLNGEIEHVKRYDLSFKNIHTSGIEDVSNENMPIIYLKSQPA